MSRRRNRYESAERPLRDENGTPRRGVTLISQAINRVVMISQARPLARFGKICSARQARRVGMIDRARTRGMLGGDSGVWSSGALSQRRDVRGTTQVAGLKRSSSERAARSRENRRGCESARGCPPCRDKGRGGPRYRGRAFARDK